MLRKRVFILFLLILSGCQSSGKEKLFHSQFSDIPMNSDIRFWIPTERFIIGSQVTLDLENISSNKIIFSPDNDVKALVFENNTWIEVENSAIYYPPGVERQISPKGPDNLGVVSVSLVPQLYKNEPITIRVVVVGYICKNGERTNERTGAYIDIKLEP